MHFDPVDFSQFNEADVREEILAPLLSYLGYKTGTPSNIIREQSLRYPRAFIGKKNTNKDPILRGVADYICEVNGSVRWVIEAKSPNIDITLEDIEQTYTYANYPEVRAVYFCITNGKELKIYQTNLGPNTDPLISLRYDNLNDSLQTLENLIGPKALLRDHPRQVIDVREPIGPGLRSIVRITNGHIIYKTNSLNIPILNGLTIGITNGAVERDEQGHLVAFLKTLSPYQSLQLLNEKLGVAQFEVVSTDKTVSIDKNNPTIFRAQHKIILPAGERVLNMLTWEEVELPMNVTCNVETIASGTLQEYTFSGQFIGKVYYVEMNINLVMSGEFEVHVV